MKIQPPANPNLPLPTLSYEQRYFNELLNVLRIYFNQISNGLQILYGTLGGRILNTPFASYYTTTTQTAAAVNTAYPIAMDPAVYENGISLVSSDHTKIQVANPGAYNFQFSMQLAKSNASVGNIWVWYRINGVDVPYSASQIAVQGTNAQTIAAWNFVVTMNAGDYFQLMWAVDDTHTQIIAYPATAFAPAIPPVIMTVTFVSALNP